MGHHQGRICYKSDVTFVLANYYCVRTSLLLEIMALAFKCNSVNKFCQSRAESTRDTYNYGQYLNQSPPEYDKSNTGIRTDPKENM